MATRKILSKRFLILLCVILVFAVGCPAGIAWGRSVLAFYYPWYGVPDGPGGAGRTVHWGRIDTDKKDIQASTDYPRLGAYDSHDPKLIDQHCRWAKEAGIETFIVSWWGHGSFSDRAMNRILDGCLSHGLTACIYYETVPKPQTPDSAADDIIKVLDKYAKHRAHLKVNGKPVVFVYGRALQELGLVDWLEAMKRINEGYEGGVTAIGDQFSYGAARVFDGIHTYNTAGQLRERSPAEARRWASETYTSWVQLADGAGKISAITIIPGYDDTKIRTPGLAVKRYEGELYRCQWEEAMKADPHWILITSFNEWHEGSEIEPSLEYGRLYLDLTAKYAKSFTSNKGPRRVKLQRPSAGGSSTSVVSTEEKEHLRQRLEGLRIGVLPGAESMAFWWLQDLGVDMEMLSWEGVVEGDLKAQRYPLLLYCAGEHYRRTVRKTADVDDALTDYLKADGYLIVLPGKPWPFYYDENGRSVNRSNHFGLSLRMGWENPPKDERLEFVQSVRHLRHVPERFGFPTSGDLRWRPSFADNAVEYTSLLQLRHADGEYLGDAAAYTALKDGGRVLYVCFNLLEGPYAEVLLYDAFDFVAGRVRP